MQNVADIFDAFGGPANLGRAVGVRTEHATTMRRRGSIPTRYWLRLVSAAAEAGRDDITLEVLARVHAARFAEETAA